MQVENATSGWLSHSMDIYKKPLAKSRVEKTRFPGKLMVIHHRPECDPPFTWSKISPYTYQSLKTFFSRVMLPIMPQMEVWERCKSNNNFIQEKKYITIQCTGEEEVDFHL